MKLLLGIDYGTGGCKVTAIGEDGSFAGEASTEFPTHHDRPGWSEQDPSDWWNALRSSLEKLAAKGVDLKSVAACALDGSTHNAVLLDGGYRPVRRTIMWTDQRATVECEALRAGWGEKVFSTCYQMPAPTWTLPQMMWLKANEPESLAKTEHVLFVKDYVRYLLTGEAATDRIEAQGTLFFDMAKGKWDDDLVLMSGLRPDSLPRLIEPGGGGAGRSHHQARDCGERQLDDRRGASASEDAHILAHRARDVVFGIRDERRGAVHAVAARRVLFRVG